MNGVGISNGIALALVSCLGAFILIALSAVLIIIHRANKYDDYKADINTAEIIDLEKARRKRAINLSKSNKR